MHKADMVPRQLLIVCVFLIATIGSLCGRNETASASINNRGVIEVDYDDVTGRGPRYYGVEWGWVDQDQELYVERLRRLHGNVVRVQIFQNHFEPMNDNNDPSYAEIDFSKSTLIDHQLGKTITYEAMFKSLVREFPDMHFQINIWLAASWNAATPDGYLGLGGAFPPRDYAEHREFIHALAQWLVSRCKIPADHLSFTFVNEPNLKSFFVGTPDDLIRMAKETRAALNEVSPAIQMGGLEEVHGTSWTDVFYSSRPAVCCDFWTFHVYEHNLSSVWNALDDRIRQLRKYGPVWVTEFADTVYGSPDAKMDFSGREAALEFAELLGRLWPTGITGIIHFRLSDTYIDTDRFGLGGWIGHGLFADSRGTHANGRPYEPFPVYWVFANMYRELGGGRIVRTTAPDGLTVVSAKNKAESKERLAVWITNSANEKRESAIRVDHFPVTTVLFEVFDNMERDTPVETKVLSDGKVDIRITIPPKSSFLYCFTSIRS